MRIHCWNYTSPKDVPEEYNRHVLLFVDDTSRGTKVICGYCDKEFVLRDTMNNCPECGRNLIFGRFDW